MIASKYIARMAQELSLKEWQVEHTLQFYRKFFILHIAEIRA